MRDNISLQLYRGSLGRISPSLQGEGGVLASVLSIFIFYTLAVPCCGQELTVNNHEPVSAMTETK